MANFQVTVKKGFIYKGIKVEAGLKVELVSAQTSAPNLLSAGKKDIIEAFNRQYGITIDPVYISSSYLDVVKK